MKRQRGFFSILSIPVSQACSTEIMELAQFFVSELQSNRKAGDGEILIL